MQMRRHLRRRLGQRLRRRSRRKGLFDLQPNEICGDGIDNNCDCVVDNCNVEDCGNGIDDDGDGLIDTEDPACVVK